MGSVEPETDGRFGLHWWQLIGVSPLCPSAADKRDTGARPVSTTAPPFLRLFISSGSHTAGKWRGEEKYDGRTEGRDGHVTQTSLTVELAWELELHQSAETRNESDMSSWLWPNTTGGGGRGQGGERDKGFPVPVERDATATHTCPPPRWLLLKWQYKQYVKS